MSQSQTLPPTVAYIYDRHANSDSDALRARLEACSAYAREQGWDIGGWHVDKGPDAVTERERPALDTLLRVMGQTTPGHQRIMLIHSWDRLSASLAIQGACLWLVRSTGGSTRTVTGGDAATDRPEYLSKLARAV